MGMMRYEFMDDGWNGGSNKEEYFWAVDEKLLTVHKLRAREISYNDNNTYYNPYEGIKNLYATNLLDRYYKKLVTVNDQYILGENVFKTKDEAITKLLGYIQDQIEILDNRIDQLEILRNRAENSKDDDKEISNLSIFQYRVSNPEGLYFESNTVRDLSKL